MARLAPALSCLVVVAATLLAPRPAFALEIWASGDGLRAVELSPSLKIFFFGTTGLLAAPPGYDELRATLAELTGADPGAWPYPDVGGGALGRLRLRFLADLHERVRLVVHYEHRPRVLSHGRLLGAAGSALQGDETVPLRITPLQWEIAASTVETGGFDDVYGPAASTFVWEHEIDRLFFAFALPGADVTIGRQAVGWGLGRLWSPLDVFAPLTATDIDRDERRGIDALRLTFPFSATALMEVVVAAGAEPDDDGDLAPAWSASSVAWLVRWIAWDVEWMLMAGKVGPDEVVGGAIAGQIRGVGVRGEVTATTVEGRRTYDGDELTGFDPTRDETNVRATVGVEFGTSFNLTGVVEYHYNGFGELRTGNYLALATNADLASRMSRGLVSGLGRHYVGVVLAYQPLPSLAITLLYMQNLQDGSLVLAPALEYVITDEVRLSFSAFVPLGRGPEWRTEAADPREWLRAHSEHGLAAQLYVLQLRAAL
jgi:hypothetical protein